MTAESLGGSLVNDGMLPQDCARSVAAATLFAVSLQGCGEALYHVGVLGGDVGCFAGIIVKVEKLRLELGGFGASFAGRFPAGPSRRYAFHPFPRPAADGIHAIGTLENQIGANGFYR